jgi:type I restriction enzyme S subunit
MLDLRFLGFYIRTPEFRDQVSAQGSTNYAAIRPRDVLAYTIPLPSLAEQQRLVAKLATLTTRIDEVTKLRYQTNLESKTLMAAMLGQEFQQLAIKHEPRLLGSLTTCITDGPHITPTYVTDGVPFVTVKNMVSGTLDFRNLQCITEQDHLEISKRCNPERGDVLYSKDGATRGFPCYVDTDREFNIFVSVALIKPIRDALDGRYLTHLLNSRWIKDRVIDRSRGDMIPHIVLREIRAFPVPCPPLGEQLKLVAHFDDMKDKHDCMLRTQVESEQAVRAMLPSILNQAFQGELS